jgi:poly-gamma-glutamate synthesis protein (capsule biosynthesis protein)
MSFACLCALLTACTAGQQQVPAPSKPTAPSTEAKQRQPPGFSVLATGDILIHPRITRQATIDGHGRRDYRKIFAGIKPTVSAADLALCHLEIPLAGPGGPFSGYPAFSAPPEVATAIADTGYDSCSTASNHTLDQGPRGVRSTLDALDANGVRHTGSARSRAEASKPLLMNVHGVRVAQLAYTFGFNGIEPPNPWIANVIDPRRIIADAHRARKAGAQVVIVSMHWGVEDQHAVTPQQRAVAHRLLANDAIDLIVGHHAHVVQPFQKIGRKWVVYGLGNSLARHDEPTGDTEEGAMARFHFTRGPDGWTVDNAEYLPTLVKLGPPVRLVRLSGPRAKRTAAIVGSLGAADDGLHRGK